MAEARSLFEVIIEAVDKFSAPLEAMEKRVHHMTAPLRELSERIEHLGKAAGIEEIGEAFKNVGERVEHAGEMIGEFLGPLAALGAVGSLAGLVEAAIKVSETGERIHDAALKIGIDAESLQKLDFAAKLNSVDPEALEKGLTKLNRTLGDAAAGKNKNAAQMFQRLGIHIRDAKGHVRDAAQVLPQLAEALQKNVNPAVRTRIAVTAFAKAGAEMLPMLIQGKEKLAEWGEEAEKAGILTNEQVDKSKEFADKNAILRASIDGLVNAIGAGLLPVMQPIVERITEWVQANRELIATKIEAMVERLTEALSKVDFEKIIEGVKETVEQIGGWIARNVTLKEGVLAIVAVLTGPFLLALTNIGIALVTLGATAIPVALGGLALLLAAFSGISVKLALAADGLSALTVGIPLLSTALSGLSGAFLAVGAAIEATPIGWILTGIAAIAAAGIYAYTHWDQVKTALVNIWTELGIAFSTVWDGIREAVAGAGARLMEGARAVYDGIHRVVDFLDAGWARIAAATSAAWSAIVGWVTGAVTAMRGGVMGMWDGIADRATAAWNGITSALRSAWDTITGIFDSAWAKIKPILDGVFDNRVVRFVGNLLADDGGAQAVQRLGQGAAGLGGLPIRQSANDNADDSAPSRAQPPANDIFAPRPNILRGPLDQQPSRLDGQVDVNVNLTGAPPGTRVTTTSKGPVAPQTSVGYNMRSN